MTHENPTSIYLNRESKERLAEIAKVSNISRSEVVRGLILNAGSENKLRLRQLVAELAELIEATK